MQIKALTSDGLYFTHEAGNNATHFALQWRPEKKAEELTLPKAVRLKPIYKDESNLLSFDFVHQACLPSKYWMNVYYASELPFQNLPIW